MKGEFDFIEDIRRMFPAPEGITGIGDDCAIVPQQYGCDTLVSTDLLCEGSHFLLDDITPYQLGWKSAAVNFSDIAAMGGSPVGSFLALSLRRDLPEGWENEFLRGYRDISQMYGFPLLGGDTVASDRVTVCVTVLGKALSGRSLRRSGARAGDLVCVTGNLGDSAAGLKAVLDGLPRSGVVPVLIERHYLPRPRLNEGQALALCPGVHSMMDVSDGIASDLLHIMEESDVGMEIDLQSLPLSDELSAFCNGYGLDPYAFAVESGEDYELLFTVDPSAELALNVPHTVIGSVTSGSSLVWKGSSRQYRGYRHF